MQLEPMSSLHSQLILKSNCSGTCLKLIFNTKFTHYFASTLLPSYKVFTRTYSHSSRGICGSEFPPLCNHVACSRSYRSSKPLPQTPPESPPAPHCPRGLPGVTPSRGTSPSSRKLLTEMHKNDAVIGPCCRLTGVHAFLLLLHHYFSKILRNYQ